MNSPLEFSGVLPSAAAVTLSPGDGVAGGGDEGLIDKDGEQALTAGSMRGDGAGGLGGGGRG